MMGEQEAVVLEVRPVSIHGLAFVDVTLGFPDRATERSRLGPEAVPEDLQQGERVLATKVANIVISVRRPDGD
jgi:hypothetical protein